MSSTTAILPVKGFARAKQRLAEALGPGPRQALVQAMLCDVLVALRRSQSLERVLVVTQDLEIQQLAGGYGAEVLADEERGHSAAARAGVEHALAQGAERVILLASDCPLADAAELDALLARVPQGREAVIVPDRHGTGTNALLLHPPDALEPAFGPDSCERHRQGAVAAGSQPEVVAVPGLALDVDTAEDLQALQAELQNRFGGAARTRGTLAQLARSRGL